MTRSTRLAVWWFLALGSTALAEEATTVHRAACAIEGGALIGCDPVIRVVRGQPVEISWNSDAAHALHLHGYDLMANPRPDAPAVVAFVATATGRFPIAIHDGAKTGHKHAHRPLLYLEVMPR